MSVLRGVTEGLNQSPVFLAADFLLILINMMIITTVLGFFLGTIIGSFAKAMADRSLSDKSFFGRSHCDKCKTALGVLDLFPLFSFLFLKGRCRHCHKPIGKEYFLAELFAGLVIGLLFWSLDFSNPGGYYDLFIMLSDIGLKLIFLAVLIMVFITDIKEMLIPDRIILPAIVIAFVWLLIDSVVKVGYLYYFLSLTLLGKFLLPPHSDYFYRHAIDTAMPLIGGVLSGFGIATFFILLIIVTRGKGMGGGDVKLGAFMGLILGFPNAVLALILSFITGAIFSIGLIILGKKHFGQTIPFGPFLVLGSIIAMFWGEQIVNWYLHLSF